MIFVKFKGSHALVDINMDDDEKAIYILKSSERSYEDLEWLSIYLLGFKDYNNYVKNLSQVLSIQLARKLSIAQYFRNQTVFEKGDYAQNWLVVFQGELKLLYPTGGEKKIVSKVLKGTQIGEREILRNKKYSLTCVPHKFTYLISLPSLDFINILGDQLDQRLTTLKNFTDSYIPNMHSYSSMFKEKIGYLLVLDEYKRGEIVINKDSLHDFLYFVFEGEAAVSVEIDNKYKNLVKLGTGMCFAEECAFMGKPSLFTIRISSERAIIASLHKSKLSSLPEDTIATLKKNLQDKITTRKTLLKINRSSNSYSINNSPEFKSANRQAREKLMTYILRNRPITPKRVLQLSRIKHKNFKDQLQMLRDCSPKRLSPVFDKKYSSDLDLF